MITYEWDFPQFHTHVSKDGLKDVVYNVEYVLTAHDGEGHGYQIFGNVDVAEADPINFKPFKSLTHRVVVPWVESALGAETLADLKQTLTEQIELQRTPATATLNRPW